MEEWPMRHAWLAIAALAATAVTPIDAAPPQPPGSTINLACSGPDASAARKIAIREKLSLGSSPQACLAQASMYGGSSKQLIVAEPSAACGRLKAIQIYERSVAGPWGSLLEKPVCGSRVSFGPKNPWGATMITIDGKHYDQRGQYYTHAEY
jgi:hypothetical protein